MFSMNWLLVLHQPICVKCCLAQTKFHYLQTMTLVMETMRKGRKRSEEEEQRRRRIPQALLCIFAYLLLFLKPSFQPLTPNLGVTVHFLFSLRLPELNQLTSSVDLTFLCLSHLLPRFIIKPSLSVCFLPKKSRIISWSYCPSSSLHFSGPPQCCQLGWCQNQLKTVHWLPIAS